MILQCVIKQSLATCRHTQHPHKQDTQLRNGRREPQKPATHLWKLGRRGDSSLEQQSTDRAGDATCSTVWDSEAFLLSTRLTIHFLLLTLTGTGNSAGNRLQASVGRRQNENSMLVVASRKRQKGWVL